jgi:6-pyruvoyltetrahydropterin/6-carboxytetrahydropterin synthase
MSGVTCTRRIEWDAGHRVPLHGGKCQHVHGHRYAAEITCSVDVLTPEGFVVDFGEVKRIVGGWVDDAWDHVFIAQAGDPVGYAIEDLGHRVYWLTTAPTAENLAAHLLVKARELLMTVPGLTVDRVRVYETPNGWAEAS